MLAIIRMASGVIMLTVGACSHPAAPRPDFELDIRGAVTAAAGGSGLPGATVKLAVWENLGCLSCVASTRAVTTADSGGHFAIRALIASCDPRGLTLIVSAVGYQDGYAANLLGPDGPQCVSSAQTLNVALAK